MADGQPSRARAFVRFAGSLVANWFPILAASLIALYAVVLGRFVGPSRQVSGISGQLREALLFSAFTGLLAMSVVEVFKRLFGLRGLYQRRQIRRWLADRAPREGGAAFDELVRAIGIQGPRWEISLDSFRYDREIKRLFNLPIEQVAGQVSDAAEVALSQHQRYPSFLVCLAGSRRFVSELLDSDEPLEAMEPRRLEVASQRIRAGVDALQISVGERWRIYVRSTAIWVSGGLGVLLTRGGGGSNHTGSSVLILCALVLGGAFSWFSRDVWASVERLRR